MKRILLGILLITIIGIYSYSYTESYKADYDTYKYYSNKDGFDKVDKSHDWELLADGKGGTIQVPEVSHVYYSETDSYGTDWTYTQHSYCAKCGFDFTMIDKKGLDGYLEHKKTGCSYGGRVTDHYIITVHWPDHLYKCKKCGAIKSFVSDASQEGLFNRYCIQTGAYDKIVWYITGTCTSPSPSQSTTSQPTTSSTSQPTTSSSQNPKVKAEIGDRLMTRRGEYVVTGSNTVSFDKNTSNEKSVTVPDTVKYNGKSYTVTTVANKAFSDNKTLKTVTIGKNITEIGNSTFSGCTNLKTVSIKSKKLKRIGAGAFKDCKNIKSISFSGTSLRTISSNAFYGCKNLKSITIKSSKVTFGKNCFKGISKNAVFKVPKSKVKSYRKSMVERGKAPSKIVVKKY